MNETMSSIPAEDRLETVKATAEMLSVGERTIWSLIREGELKVVRIGRCTRVRRSSIFALMSRNAA